MPVCGQLATDEGRVKECSKMPNIDRVHIYLQRFSIKELYFKKFNSKK